MAMFKFDDPTLFGSEAADLEDASLFFSYAMQRPEVVEFLDDRHAVRIVSAYKGEGKSALLRLAEQKLKDRPSQPLVIRVTGSSIAPPLSSLNEDEWIRAWKQSIFALLAREIGATIKIALTDDATTLVEEAEREGFRQRSIFGYVLDRIKIKDNPILQEKPALASAERILQRWLSSNDKVWLLVDDIDHNYANNDHYRVKLSSFLAAVKDLMVKTPEVRIRFTIRPNVWQILRRNYEGVSHFRESVLPLSWTLQDCELMVSRRVEGYLHRSGEWSRISRTLPMDARRVEALNKLLFETPMPWGRDSWRPATVVLYTLSRHRPRWLIELIKESAKRTNKRGGSKINWDDIKDVLASFSKNRYDDTIVEFKSHCAELPELLTAFANQRERYTTDELLKLFRDSVLQQVHPKISGYTHPVQPREVAHFLFEIGFLSARLDRPDGSYEHATYADQPDLLDSRVNLDQGYSWEIHPVFRHVLKLRSF
ncbi:P-loop ATPase, Sll1717 family [Rhizobacter sp. Root1221]|uniref:P-loop ATPase, Sll1717 family n=1 Tax=Rhizobacter sp. Root1221 TaxID=1736433 RepID=UPI000B2055DA|nr:hypothetical protein [Rhizobacter sp. Root1221]